MDTKEEKSYDVTVTYIHSPDVFCVVLKINEEKLVEVVAGAFNPNANFVRFDHTYLRASEIKSIQVKELS